MKFRLPYYGGKVNMIPYILPKLPDRKLYCEPFVGGGAILWAKTYKKGEIEVINDLNGEIVNFYKVCKLNFTELQRMVKVTLHSRAEYNLAKSIYTGKASGNAVERAWAFWVLCVMSFAGIMNGVYGFDMGAGDNGGNKKSLAIHNRREEFTPEMTDRLSCVNIECDDALKIIKRYDAEDSFFYLDPPYFNSNMGHYAGYTEADFTALLDICANIKGKFLLSSYPSDILTEFTKKYSWELQHIQLKLKAQGGSGNPKTEVLTANYAISENRFKPSLF